MANPRNAQVPPHSSEAEQAVLGSFLMAGDIDDSNAIVLGKLSDDDFYRKEHQWIFAAIKAVVDKGKPLDVLVLTEKLRNQKRLKAVGGTKYLAELAENTPEAINAEAYADIVLAHAIRRRLLDATRKIASAVFGDDPDETDFSGTDIDSLIDHAESLIFAVRDEKTAAQSGLQPMEVLLPTAHKTIQKWHDAPGALTGMPTGFKTIDGDTSGLQRGDLVVIAGRPSMGKTSLALNIVEHVIMHRSEPALFFSLEMPAIMLVIRLLASLSRVNQQKIRQGKTSETDRLSLVSSVSLLENKPFFVDDSFSLTPLDLKARARRVAVKYGSIGVIVVDYLQLMRGSTRRREENRVAEISEISRALKALAKEMSCPVIALSQLNRSVESRSDKRPVMADLRDSGAIEQDADLIMFIYRDEVYNSESEDKGKAEIIIAKQRNGPTGTHRLAFLPHLTRFENLELESYEGV